MPPTPPNTPTRSRRADEADGVRLAVAPAPGARRSRRRSARLQPKLPNKPMPPLPSTPLRPEGRAPRGGATPPHAFTPRLLRRRVPAGRNLCAVRRETGFAGDAVACATYHPVTSGLGTGVPRTSPAQRAKENSPALQCWVLAQSIPSPVRDDRSVGTTPLSSLSGLGLLPAANPALKCWAIFGRPCGTGGSEHDTFGHAARGSLAVGGGLACRLWTLSVERCALNVSHPTFPLFLAPSPCRHPRSQPSTLNVEPWSLPIPSLPMNRSAEHCTARRCVASIVPSNARRSSRRMVRGFKARTWAGRNLSPSLSHSVTLSRPLSFSPSPSLRPVAAVGNFPIL